MTSPEERAVRDAVLAALTRAASNADHLPDHLLVDWTPEPDQVLLGSGLAQWLQVTMIRAGTKEAERLTPVAKAVVDLPIGFDRIDPRAVDWAQTQAANLVTQITEQQRAAVRGIVASSFTDPATGPDTARRIRSVVGLHPRYATAVDNAHLLAYKRNLKAGMADDVARDAAYAHATRYRDRLIRSRANTIARTEIMTAQNTARQLAWTQQVEDGVLSPMSRKKWVAHDSIPMAPTKSGKRLSNPCRDCAALHGQTRRWDEPWPNGKQHPPAHPNCFPAGVVVSGPAAIGATRRWYEGEMLRIVTAGGGELTVTPNHPVLTDQGWLPAGQVDEGTHLVGDGTLQSMLAGDPDDQQRPAPIEDVLTALLEAAPMTAMAVPVAPEDFHGDGFDGEVDVVHADRLLRHRAHVDEPLGEEQFVRTGDGEALTGRRDARSVLDALALASDGVVRRFGEPGALLRAGLRHADGHGLRASTPLHPGLVEDPVDDVAGDPVLFRKGLDALAGQVVLDKVVQVRREPFSGHVYNLQTTGEWYIASGFIVHNCRCVQVVLPPPLPGDDDYLDDLSTDSINAAVTDARDAWDGYQPGSYAYPLDEPGKARRTMWQKWSDAGVFTARSGADRVPTQRALDAAAKVQRAGNLIRRRAENRARTADPDLLAAAKATRRAHTAALAKIRHALDKGEDVTPLVAEARTATRAAAKASKAWAARVNAEIARAVAEQRPTGAPIAFTGARPLLPQANDLTRLMPDSWKVPANLTHEPGVRAWSHPTTGRITVDVMQADEALLGHEYLHLVIHSNPRLQALQWAWLGSKIHRNRPLWRPIRTKQIARVLDAYKGNPDRFLPDAGLRHPYAARVYGDFEPSMPSEVLPVAWEHLILGYYPNVGSGIDPDMIDLLIGALVTL